MPMKHPPPLIAVVDVARRLKLSRQRVHMMVKRYGIVLTRIGVHSSYMTEGDLNLLLDRQAANKRAMAQPGKKASKKDRG